MTTTLNFEVLDKKLRPIARRLTSSYDLIEDLIQIGKITIWEVSQEKQITSPNYLLKAAQFSMINQLKHDSAKKRRPENGFVSLQSPLSEEDSRTLEDKIGKEDEKPIEKDLTQTLIDKLRERYGKFFVNRIAKDDPIHHTRKRIIRAVIEDVAKIPFDEIPHRADYQFFVNHGLANFLWVFYENSPYKAIMAAYKGEFVSFDFKKRPQRFWQGKKGYRNALDAIAWFSKKRNINSVKDCRMIGYNDFRDESLGACLHIHFNDSHYLALKTQFPELKPWQTRTTTKRYFDPIDHRIEALLSFIMDNNRPSIISLNSEETYELGLRTFVSKDTLCNYGLRSLLVPYDNSCYRLFSHLFQNQILPWTLESKIVWREDPEETAANAVRWLFDDYLQIPIPEIPFYATNDLFWNLGFSGILTNRRLGFNSSNYEAVNNAYPNTFSPSEFTRTSPKIYIQHKNLRKTHKKTESI